MPPPPGPDAAPPAPVLATRGQACGAVACDGLACWDFPGGYCLSTCGATGSACDGACVETARDGELCMARCASDGECRVAEGYVCDRAWHACVIPNTTALVAPRCAEVARDAAFGDGEPWTDAHSPGVYQLQPAAIVLDDGSIVALAMSRGAETDSLVVLRASAESPVVSLQSPASPREHQAEPSLARGAGDRLYAAWVGFDGRHAAEDVLLATSADRGATWSTPVVVEDPAECGGSTAGCLSRPSVVVAGGVVHVLYGVRGAGLRLRTSRDGGKTFGASVLAGRGVVGAAAAGADGKLHVVSLGGAGPAAAGGVIGGYGSAMQAIEYAVSAGATFSPPVTVSAPAEMLPTYLASPRIVVDDARRWIYIAYVRGGRDAKWDIVLAASKDAGKTWTRTTLGEPCTLDMVPNLVLDAKTGTLHVAWYASAGDGAFLHATCGPGATGCRAWGRISSAPFAAFSTEREGPRWLGEAESLVIDAKRRVLHALWTQPLAGGGVSRVVHASAKLRNGV